jgi:hypothetical protein
MHTISCEWIFCLAGIQIQSVKEVDVFSLYVSELANEAEYARKTKVAPRCQTNFINKFVLKMGKLHISRVLLITEADIGYPFRNVY